MKINEIYATIKYRGIILHQMSLLEKQLDNYIIYYLTNKDAIKIAEMQLLIFGDNRMNLEGKRQVFQYIAETHDIYWYNSYKTIRKPIPKKKTPNINNDLIYSIESRNVFAHCMADTTDTAIDSQNTVGFIKFKDKAEKIHFTKDDFAELENTIVNLLRFFVERNKV